MRGRHARRRGLLRRGESETGFAAVLIGAALAVALAVAALQAARWCLVVVLGAVADVLADMG